MIHHHPGEELLLAAATRTLDTGAAVVLGAHLEGCAQCRESVRFFEAVGGAMLDGIQPASMGEHGLSRTLTAIDATAPVAARPVPTLFRPPLPPGLGWPRSLTGCEVSRWRWMGPGMRWSRVTVPHNRQANVFLLRIGKGKSLARHTHSGQELTHVMFGSFNDGRARFAAGDFDAVDKLVHHQPILEADEECVCLTSVKGRLVFDGAIARMVGVMMRI